MGLGRSGERTAKLSLLQSSGGRWHYRIYMLEANGKPKKGVCTSPNPKFISQKKTYRWPTGT